LRPYINKFWVSMEQVVSDKRFLLFFVGCIFLLETFLRIHFHGRNPKVKEVFLNAGGGGEIEVFR
jgi:hypothetical protein